LRAELISVGTELLLGEIVDTNAAYLSQKLAEIGVDVYHRHTVGDNLSRLAEAVGLALSRSDVIILSGGLGPTEDDLTRQAIAEATGRVLLRSPQAVDRLREFFASRGRVPTDNNLRQADAPEGAVLLDNPVGTAPGILLEHDCRQIYALPGPPTELHRMFTDQVLPRLEETSDLQGQRLYCHSLLLADIGESNAAAILAELIHDQSDPSIALYASPAQVRVRLATKAADAQTAHHRLQAAAEDIRCLLGDHVFGTNEDTMESVIGQLLRQRHATLSVAESCTGGLIASRITDVPGSSDYFLGGTVAYANEIKQALLGVPGSVLDTYGAVSAECAQAMAEGARTSFGTDFAAATTGIAGPDGGTPEKPVGLVYIAVADETDTHVEQHNWPGTREQFKRRVSQIALNTLRKRILGTT
jgi:nicotinamide-nucleotide amidase